MQHELRVSAEQARGIDAQREIAPDAPTGIVIDQPLGLRHPTNGFASSTPP